MEIISSYKNAIIRYDDQQKLYFVFVSAKRFDKNAKKDLYIGVMSILDSETSLTVGDYIKVNCSEADLIKINKCQISVRNGFLDITNAFITSYR